MKRASFFPVVALLGSTVFALACAAGCKTDATEELVSATPGQSTLFGILNWKGELKVAPSAPEKDWAYFDLQSEQAFYWDGVAWKRLGTEGTKGLSWRGSLATTPSSAQPAWAYHDRSLGRSLVFDGTNWLTLNPPGVSLNASGIIANGSSLLLTHNLSSRPNLTFNAQVQKDNMVYDTKDFLQRRPVNFYQRQKTLFSDTSTSINWLSVARNLNGYTLAAYEDASNGNAGTFVIIDPSGNIFLVSMLASTFFYGHPHYVSVAALANGNFVIAFRSEGDTYGYFMIIKEDGTTVRGATKFEGFSTDFYAARDISVAALDRSDSGFVISYSYYKSGIPWMSAFVVYQGNGTIVGSQHRLDIWDNYQESSVVGTTGGGFTIFRRVELRGQTFGTYQAYNAAFNPVSATSTSVSTCDAVWDAYVGTNVTSVSDTGDLVATEGSASVSITTLDAVGSNTVLATSAISSLSMTGWTGISFWIKCNSGTSNDQLQLLFDNSSSNCSTPEVTVNLAGIGSNTWYHYMIPLPAEIDGISGLQYIGLKQVPDLGALTVRLDGIKLHRSIFENQMETTSYGSGGNPLRSIVTAGGKTLVAYRDAEFSGRYKVYDPIDGSLDQQLIFSANDVAGVAGIAPIFLDNGDLALAFNDSSDNNGYFRVFSSTDEGVRQKTLFDSNQAEMINAVVLPNREFLLFYKDVNSSDNRGWFVKEGEYSIYLEKVDANSVRIRNFSGESLFLTLSVNQ